MKGRRATLSLNVLLSNATFSSKRQRTKFCEANKEERSVGTDEQARGNGIDKDSAGEGRERG